MSSQGYKKRPCGFKSCLIGKTKCREQQSSLSLCLDRVEKIGGIKNRYTDDPEGSVSRFQIAFLANLYPRSGEGPVGTIAGTAGKDPFSDAVLLRPQTADILSTHPEAVGNDDDLSPAYASGQIFQVEDQRISGESTAPILFHNNVTCKQ